MCSFYSHYEAAAISPSFPWFHKQVNTNLVHMYNKCTLTLGLMTDPDVAQSR